MIQGDRRETATKRNFENATFDALLKRLEEGGKEVEDKERWQEERWQMIAAIDKRLNLELGNHCLGLEARSGQLQIHYWTGATPPFNSHEVTITINKDWSGVKESKELSTGKVENTQVGVVSLPAKPE